MKERLLLMPLLPYAVALVCGMLAGTFIGIVSYSIVFVSVALLLGAAILLRNHSNIRILPVFLCFSLLGMLLMNKATKELSAPLPDSPERLTAVIYDSPVMREEGTTLDFYVVSPSLKGSRLRAFVSCDSLAALQYRVGQTYDFTARLRSFEQKDSLTNFNYSRWALGRGYRARCFLRPDELRLSSGGLDQLPLFSRISAKSRIVRTRILSVFDSIDIESQQRAVLEAMVLGEKSHISSATRNAFSNSGASHILALSGMHLGILYFLLSWLIVRGRFYYYGKATVLVAIWGYVMLVGMPISALRAACMLSMYDILGLFGRQRMSMNTLCFVAMVMLLVNPLCLWDLGFQLSFAAMAGILVFHKPLYNIIGIKTLFRHPLLRQVWGMTTISLSAQLVTAPLVVYYFGNVPLLFLLTNLVASTLVTIAIYLTVAGLLLGFLPFLQSWIITLAAWLIGFLNAFLGLISSASWTSVRGVHINVLQLLLLYISLVVLSLLVVRLHSLWCIYKARRTLTDHQEYASL